jgi:hypothetical protein
MLKSFTRITGLVLAAACAALIPAGAAQASTNGCSSGTVCMYTDAGWFWGNPDHHWEVYQCYNLANETGDRHVFNNQTGGASASLWSGNLGSGTKIADIAAGTTWQGDITPVNSICLSK